MTLLPKGSLPTNDLATFLDSLAKRMNMVKRGGEADIERATVYFVKWWREEGGLLSATSGTLRLRSNDISYDQRSTLGVAGDSFVPQTQAWGFDFQWHLRPEEVSLPMRDPMDILQEKMEGCIDDYIKREEAEGDIVSPTQMKKRMVLADKERRKAKWSAKQKG
jgi:hypothetical protein